LGLETISPFLSKNGAKMTNDVLPECWTCEWFRRLNFPDERGDGECMLAPPVVLAPSEMARVRYHRPVVHDGDYCARYKEAQAHREHRQAKA
jgi:hypothetical protein